MSYNSCDHLACQSLDTCRLPDDDRERVRAFWFRRRIGIDSVRDLGTDPLGFMACDSDFG